MIRILSVLVVLLVSAHLHASEKPNILFILVDDLGWPALGAYGNQHVTTPALDRLAKEGMRFTDAYSTPQCTPTRAVVLTGQNSARNRMWHVIPGYGYPWALIEEPVFQRNLSRRRFTLAKGLRSVGYRTAAIGKWHLTSNQDGDYQKLEPGSAIHYGFDYAPEDWPEGAARSGDKGVNWLTDRAIEFIETHQKQPFFVYLAHHSIHGPVLAPQELVRKYRERDYPEEGLFNATYLAAIEHLDHSVARLLARLDNLGLSNQTLVIFYSDNGGIHFRYDKESVAGGDPSSARLEIDLREFDNAPLRAGKGSPYEGGIRVPLLMRWPGKVPVGSISSAPVHAADFLPTFIEIAEAQVPEGHRVDGHSLVPLWDGRIDNFEGRPLFWYLPLYDLNWGATPCAVIRKGPFKLIEYFGDRFDRDGRYVTGHHLELYNLSQDLGEERNLAARLPDQTRLLQKALRDWIASRGVRVPSLNPYYNPAKAFRVKRFP